MCERICRSPPVSLPTPNAMSRSGSVRNTFSGSNGSTYARIICQTGRLAMDVITREELQREIADGGVVVLEALPQAYFDAEHLPGAQNLPLDEIESLAGDLVPDQSTPIVTY